MPIADYDAMQCVKQAAGSSKLLYIVGSVVGVVAVILLGAALWLFHRNQTLKAELETLKPQSIYEPVDVDAPVNKILTFLEKLVDGNLDQENIQNSANLLIKMLGNADFLTPDLGVQLGDRYDDNTRDYLISLSDRAQSEYDMTNMKHLRRMSSAEMGNWNIEEFLTANLTNVGMSLLHKVKTVWVLGHHYESLNLHESFIVAASLCHSSESKLVMVARLILPGDTFNISSVRFCSLWAAVAGR
jgi:hypothetical protein